MHYLRPGPRRSSRLGQTRCRRSRPHRSWHPCLCRRIQTQDLPAHILLCPRFPTYKACSVSHFLLRTSLRPPRPEVTTYRPAQRQRHHKSNLPALAPPYHQVCMRSTTPNHSITLDFTLPPYSPSPRRYHPRCPKPGQRPSLGLHLKLPPRRTPEGYRPLSLLTAYPLARRARRRCKRDRKIGSVLSPMHRLLNGLLTKRWLPMQMHYVCPGAPRDSMRPMYLTVMCPCA